MADAYSEPRVITIEYAPREAFLPFHARGQRFAAIVAHRRAGKTVACINDTIKRALELQRPSGRYAYVAPYLGQAKEVAWDYLIRYSRPVAKQINHSELWVELLNGSKIRIHGADNPDRLRGSYLDGVVLDEFADMRPGVWGEVIRPMLADRRGWAVFIGTPRGRNEFWELCVQAEASPDWYYDCLRASQTGLLPAAELEAARADMTPEQYEQEFECSFDAAILGAYYGREIADAEREGRITAVAIDPAIPVHTAWDLGRGDHMAIWCWQAAGGEIRVVDFLQFYGYSMEHYATELNKRGYNGTDWVPQDARVKSLETGKTRLETLVAMGRRPRLVVPHKVMDGINAVRLELRRMWIDGVRCRDGLEALRQYRAQYDEKRKTFLDAPLANWAAHAADAMRYLAMAYREERPANRVQRKDKPVRNPMTVEEFHSFGWGFGEARIGDA